MPLYNWVFLRYAEYMKKKSGKKKTLKIPSYISFKYVFLLVGCFLLLITGGIYYKKLHPVCANSISCISDLSGKIESSTEGVFMGHAIQAPDASYFASQMTVPLHPVLGTSDPDSKHIYVDLTQQKLLAFDGNTLVYNFPVSTGKWGKTPTGIFRIWIKLQATRMAGGSGDDYYNLPNVPWTMFFANDIYGRGAGYSLHGAYWHNNFGHPMSHGCINISPANAKLLFDWANPPTVGYTTYATTTNPGTMVTIYGITPNE